MNIKKYALIALLAPATMACAAPFTYQLGATRISEAPRQIVVHARAPVTVAILPGGATWPLLSLDENGRIYVGNVVIDGSTGMAVNYPKATLVLPHDVEVSARTNGFTFHHAGKTCAFPGQQLGLDRHRHALVALKNSNITFSSTPTALLALVTQFGPDGKVANYLIEQLDLDRCEIASRNNLGNPDLLIELNHSRLGGWWLTGSIEQTLMQSTDGRHWRKTALPASLSGLMSAYVANTREIWLAAILPEGDVESPYLLVYSGDAGATWRNVVADDPILDRLPPSWLEGQKRSAQQ